MCCCTLINIMAGAVVRTYGGIRNLLNPTSGLLTSRQIACGLHLQAASPVTRNHCLCQLCCQRYSKNGTAFPLVCGASYSSYSVHGCVNNLCDGNKELQSGIRNVSFRMWNKNPANISQVRNKSGSSKQNTENEEDDSDQDDALDDDDFDAPPQFKVMKITAASNRADTVISHGLNVSRSHLDEIFLKSGLYLNGDKLLKKAMKMEEGDYADVVVEKTEDQIKVKRVKVLKIYPEKTSKDKMTLKVRVWKAPFFLAKPEYKPNSS